MKEYQEYLEENYEELPQNIKDILCSFDESKDGYIECARIVTELEKIGYTMSYGLDAEPYNLRKIRTFTK